MKNKINKWILLIYFFSLGNYAHARVINVNECPVPFDFTISSLIIILSSVTFYLAFKMLQMKNFKITQLLLSITLLLALAFIYFQIQGFNGIIGIGYYFTGPESSITTSYLYILVLLHMVHLGAGDPSDRS